MKFKAAVTEGAPAALMAALNSSEFAVTCLGGIAEGVFDADSPSSRPAEYYVQRPDLTIPTDDGWYGVEMRLTGVSRQNREPRLFHEALKELDGLMVDVVVNALGKADSGVRVQVFTVIMIDGDVPAVPGNEGYSSTLESTAKWVTALGVEGASTA